MVGATESASGGGVATDARVTKGYALSVETAAGSGDGATESAGGGGVATDAGATRGRALFTKSCDEVGSDRGYRPMCARWRSTAAIAAAVTASMLQRGGQIGAGGIFCASCCYARRQALLMFAAPRYRWRKRWCIAIIMLRSMKYARGYLPSVESISSCASGVLMGIAIRSPRRGGPFGIPSTARNFFAATLSDGGGGVAGGRFGPIRTVWSCDVPECL